MEIGIDEKLWVTDGVDAEHIRIEVTMPDGSVAYADMDRFFAADLRDTLAGFVAGKLRVESPSPALGYVHTLNQEAREDYLRDNGDPAKP